MICSMKPVYKIDNDAEQQMNVLANILNKFREKLQASKIGMVVKQHKQEKNSKYQEKRYVMVCLPESNSKL